MRPGKIGEIKQVVRTPASWNAFIAASRRSMLTALSISARKSSSSVFDRPGYPRIGECFNEVKVTQHQVRLGSNTEATFTALHLLQNGAGAAGGFLQRLIWVGHVTEKQFFPCIPLRVFDFRPKFNVYELSPGLRVIGKTLHKRCVAIFAAVATAHIRIDRIITHRQIVKERIEGGANEKAVLRLFINCPFVCINFDFFWLNKARQLYMDF